MRTFQHTGQGGSTLIEASIAAAICALFLGSLFTLNTQTMSTLKMAREVACASQVLQQRIEGMRIANWHQVTDADWLAANLLNTDAAGSAGLKSVSETLHTHSLWQRFDRHDAADTQQRCRAHRYPKHIFAY